MNETEFENNLNEVLFTEYFNCYLALPIFPRTIQYVLPDKQFEEIHLDRDKETCEPQDALQVDSLIPPSLAHSHAPSVREDNYVATLDRARTLDWIYKERLPSFLKSDLHCEYNLASLLSRVEQKKAIFPSVKFNTTTAVSNEQNGDVGINYHTLGSKREIAAFKNFLVGTSGENDYLYWIECQRISSCDSSDVELLTGLKEIKVKYLIPGGKCELAKGRWVHKSHPLTRDDIFALQQSVLHSLVSYWCPRYLMSANNRRVKSPTELSKRLRPAAHQGRASVLNESQKSALKCDPESLRELASPLIFPQLSPSHLPLSSTPYPTYQIHTTRSFSVAPAVRKLPNIHEYSLAESVALPRSHTVMYQNESQKRHRSRSVPLPQVIMSTKERKVNEQLTMCLSMEHRKAGGIFQQYIEKIGTTIWKNCLFCWREIQNFKAGFTSEDFNPFQVQVRAKTILSKFVLSSGDMFVSCKVEIGDKISESIYPAFEDLFDSLEEYLLDVLNEPWTACLSEESTFLEQAKSDDVAFSHWEIDDDEFLEELGVDLETVEDEHVVQQTAEEITQVEIETNRLKLPLSSSVGLATPIAYTIQQIIQENTLLNLLKNFLDSRHASVDIMFWMEVESFRRIPAKEAKLRNAKAKLIRSQYLTKNYYFGLNSPASKEAQNRLIMLGGLGHKVPQRPPTPILIEGQKQVQARLEHRWLPVFVKTREFLEYVYPGQEHYRAPISQHNQAMTGGQDEWKSKLFESRWMTNSRDIINCRKAMLNPVTCKPFETFVELKSSKDEHLKNDLNFWLEIQRFKELCHSHTPDAVLQLKIDVIVNCFLQSKVPPKIQVDLSQEMVEKVQRKPIGPYMFREPQAEMFRVIFSYWMEYQAFKEQHKGEDIEIAFMELRQQIHEKEILKLKKQRDFDSAKMQQHLRPFGMHGLHGEEDPPADMMFRLSDAVGQNKGISSKKRGMDSLTNNSAQRNIILSVI